MNKNDHSNVIYDKKTGMVLFFESNENWVIPEGYELAHFENGVEPVFEKDEDGRLYLKPNTFVITDY